MCRVILAFAVALGFLFFASSRANAQDEKLVEGRVITLCYQNSPTILAPSESSAQIFRDIRRNDFAAAAHRATGNQEWIGEVMALTDSTQLLKKSIKAGAFKVVNIPTKAKVVKVAPPTENDINDLYEIEILEGIFKGQRFWYSFDYDKACYALVG